MKNMVKLCNVCISLTMIVACIALVMALSKAWLAYIPYVNLAAGYASPIFWRCLISLFWWVVVRWIFKKIAGDDEIEEDT